ncbi:MAG: hypothetical protein K2X43_08190 [Hyphomonadaceae bacterium]|nr:hypothetical protein [Hyphomonadaceae bacterium]
MPALKDLPSRATVWFGVTWFGIAGAATTLFASLLSPLELTDWAWWLVQSWQGATSSAWHRLADVLGVEIPSALMPPLTMSTLLLLTGIGVGRRENSHQPQTAVSYPILQLSGAIAALLAIGHILCTNPVGSNPVASVSTGAPWAILLAGAAVSFSPMIAGGGNLAKRLWFVLIATCILFTLNELTKLVL